jgi:hypothetical protein
MGTQQPPYKFVVGIDPGVQTGFAVRSVDKGIIRMECLKIHNAMDLILYYQHRGDSFVFVEDARLVKNYHPGNKNIGRLQGVGSVKRDAGIWEDFLKEKGVSFLMIKPVSQNTKWSAEKFKKMTGWSKRTNNHTRDAGVLCLMNIPPGA